METGIPWPLLHDNTSLPLLPQEHSSQPFLGQGRTLGTDCEDTAGNVLVPSSWSKASLEPAQSLFMLRGVRGCETSKDLWDDSAQSPAVCYPGIKGRNHLKQGTLLCLTVKGASDLHSADG